RLRQDADPHRDARGADLALCRDHRRRSRADGRAARRARARGADRGRPLPAQPAGCRHLGTCAGGRRGARGGPGAGGRRRRCGTRRPRGDAAGDHRPGAMRPPARRRRAGGRHGHRPGADDRADHRGIRSGRARRGPPGSRRGRGGLARASARRLGDRRGRDAARAPARVMLLNVRDYEREAERVLDPGAFGYFAGGAGGEVTLRDNIEAFSRWQLRPRVLVDAGEVTTATTVLGREVSMPVLVAPIAFQRLAHAEAEVATARAAADRGTVMCQSTLSSVTPAELSTAAPDAHLWFQLYWSRDRAFTAVVFTVDFPVAGRRERDLRGAFALPKDLSLPNIPGPLARQDFHADLG